ncbi:MAG: KIX-binding domain of forkhead box O, CR2, partial [Paramarteilia canceri]
VHGASSVLDLDTNKPKATFVSFVDLGNRKTQAKFSPISKSDVNKKVSKKKKKLNPWGECTYAELIEKAILSSPIKRLTLNEIYEYFTEYSPHFCKGGSIGSAESTPDDISQKMIENDKNREGWKNSIRHNLSLRKQFIRCPDPGTKKYYWTLDRLVDKQSKLDKDQISINELNEKARDFEDLLACIYTTRYKNFYSPLKDGSNESNGKSRMDNFSSSHTFSFIPKHYFKNTNGSNDNLSEHNLSKEETKEKCVSCANTTPKKFYSFHIGTSDRMALNYR